MNKEIKKRLISLIVALNMIINLSSCTFKANNNNSNEKRAYGFEDTLSNNNAKDKIEYFNNDIQASSLAIINDVETFYGFDDYYPTLDTINDYKKLAETTIDCPVDDTNYMQLLDIIEKNTIRQYGKSNGIFIIPEENYSDDELLRLAEVNRKFRDALKKALKNIFANATNDIADDISKLKSISIIEKDLSKLDEGNQSDSRTLGLWENESLTITIDYNALIAELESTNADRIEDGRTEINIIEYLTRTIEHEINHARQYACEDRLKHGQKYENISLIDNPSFFIESSAESELYVSKKIDDLLDENSGDYTYSSERDYESLLFLLTVFKKDNLEGYYNAIFDSNLNAFWDYFELDTPEKLRRFYSILYSIDTLCGRTDLTTQIAGPKTHISHAELKKNVGTSYLIDLFKFNVVDLINAIENDNLSYEDSLLLYLYSKSYVTDSIQTSTILKHEDGKFEEIYDDYYVSAIIIIENTFMEYICSKFGMSNTESREMLESFDLNMRFSSFIDYALGNNTNCSWNDKRNFDKLLKKYPLIKYMLWINTCNSFNASEFDRYVKNSEKKLILN